MAMVLDGRAPAREMEAQLAARVAAFAGSGARRPPGLAVLLVGADPTGERHARLKEDACRRLGMEARLLRFPAAAPTAEVLAAIDRLNLEPEMDGIFLQHPVPPQVDERACFDRIAPAKDVGGDGTLSLGRLLAGQSAFPATTPAAVMRLLAHYGLDPAGRRAVVVGRSPMVGKPMAVLLLAAHATVTIAHSRTRDLPGLVRRAEILVAAAGRPALVPGDWIRVGAIVVDAGYHPGEPGGSGRPGDEPAGAAGVAARGAADGRAAAGARGDVDLGAAADRCLAYTPVPGGVGPMTLATLLSHTLQAAEAAR